MRVYHMLSHQTIAVTLTFFKKTFVANYSQCKFYTKVTHQSKLKNDRIEDRIRKYEGQRGFVAFLGYT